MISPNYKDMEARPVKRFLAHIALYLLDVLCSLTGHAYGCVVQNKIFSRLNAWALDALWEPDTTERVTCPTCGYLERREWATWLDKPGYIPGFNQVAIIDGQIVQSTATTGNYASSATEGEGEV